MAFKNQSWLAQVIPRPSQNEVQLGRQKIQFWKPSWAPFWGRSWRPCGATEHFFGGPSWAPCWRAQVGQQAIFSIVFIKISTQNGLLANLDPPTRSPTWASKKVLCGATWPPRPVPKWSPTWPPKLRFIGSKLGSILGPMLAAKTENLKIFGWGEKLFVCFLWGGGCFFVPLFVFGVVDFCGTFCGRVVPAFCGTLLFFVGSTLWAAFCSLGVLAERTKPQENRI